MVYNTIKKCGPDIVGLNEVFDEGTAEVPEIIALEHRPHLAEVKI